MKKPFPSIIGITGQATAGKTSLANIIIRNYPGFVRLSFADPIRAMLKAIGLTDAELSEGKHLPNPKLCMRTPRYAMQKLGTEWGREMIGDDIWRDAAKRQAIAAYQSGLSVVFDDVRFDNEAWAIREIGGIVISVWKPGLPPPMDHASEQGIAPALTDHFISAHDLAELERNALGMFNEFYE